MKQIESGGHQYPKSKVQDQDNLPTPIFRAAASQKKSIDTRAS